MAETNASQPATPKLGEGALLAGLVFDDRGNPMVLVHTKRGAKRYRYYVSKPKLTGRGAAGSLERISAGMLEQFLTARVQGWLSPGWIPDASLEARLRSAISQLVVGEDQIVIKAHSPAVRSNVLASKDAAVEDNGQMALRVSFQMHRRRGEWLIEPEGPRDVDERNPDRTLIRAITLACTWSREVEMGSTASITDFAERQSPSANYTARLLPLAYLVPDLTAQILEGRQARNVTLALLTASPPPLSWEEQRRCVRAL